MTTRVERLIPERQCKTISANLAQLEGFVWLMESGMLDSTEGDLKALQGVVVVLKSMFVRQRIRVAAIGETGPRGRDWYGETPF